MGRVGSAAVTLPVHNALRASALGHAVAMDLVEHVGRLGGIARWRQLRCTSREIQPFLQSGELVRLRRGVYALPAADSALAAAARLGGHASHTSAALALGWEVRTVPAQPIITVPKHRRFKQEVAGGVQVRWADLEPDDRNGLHTSADRTLLDCMRLPHFAEALSVADSALRHGYSHRRMLALARDARGPGSRRAREVAALADGRSANPFESSLRAIALRVPGLSVTPQLRLGERLVDLGDENLRLLLEADSFEWHGRRAALDRDCRRYNGFVVEGWLVLKFSWEWVMFEPEDVERVLRAATQVRTQRCSCGDVAA